MKAKTSNVLKSKTPKVYKNKKLNNANFGDFTHSDYKVYLHLISKLGGVDEYGKYLQAPEELKRAHVLTAKEFSDTFNVDIKNSYGFLKQAVDKLMKTDIRIERPEDKGYWRINVCSTAEYCEKEGRITIEFTDRIMPYLAQVRERFTLYNLKEVSGFNSLYTTRLYELIQEFKETGWIRRSIEQLREIFAVGDKLAIYADFKRKTFEHACNEINKVYDYGLSFKEIKEGRKVAAIEFSFKKAVITKAMDPKTLSLRNIYHKPQQNKNTHESLSTGFKSIEDILK